LNRGRKANSCKILLGLRTFKSPKLQIPLVVVEILINPIKIMVVVADIKINPINVRFLLHRVERIIEQVINPKIPVVTGLVC
jgi:hypothetical protein